MPAMSIRTELTKLRQQARQVGADSNVKAISDLMDELSAEAAGGAPCNSKTLADYFEPESQPQINPE
jgi:hypothetical protein